MHKCDVVIGLNYGDEGKGLVTDYLTHRYFEASNTYPLIARFNGGANAAHTVKLHNGTSHVFHHFCSGTLQGAESLLTHFFAVDPLLFFLEANTLILKIEEIPTMYVDPECPIVTPMEIMFNQALEKQRDGNRHGSCGVGFGEAIAREESGHQLRVKHCKNEAMLRQQISKTMPYWSNRKNEIGEVESMSLEPFIQDALDFYKFVTVVQEQVIIFLADHIIFEGAQGLNLDQYSPDFPHVTRSSTGLENVAALLFQCRDVIVNIHYVTRAYLTRHGAGPLKHELPEPTEIIDTTNRPNDYQGALRFAPLDYERIRQNVTKDTKHFIDVEQGFLLNAVVTCCDQSDKINTNISVNEIIVKVAKAIRTPQLLTSWGPARECVVYPLEASFSDLGIK